MAASDKASIVSITGEQSILRDQAVAVALRQPLTLHLTGGTGLIGSRLISKLTSQGSKVRVLTRDPASARKKLQPILVGSSTSNVEFFAPSDWSQGIRGSTACINLAGEPIATRWTPDLKKEIMRSRVEATNRLVKEISALSPDQRPKLFLSSSAVGFYGISQSSTFTEDSPNGSDYLAQVCKEWESAAMGAKALGLRTVIMRTGIVLAREGGALGKMLPIFSLFAGGPLGTGKQWMSWIHREDLVDLILLAIKDESFNGVYNGTAPRPIR
jgi:uncharacterized protein (TIGR01777 family)